MAGYTRQSTYTDGDVIDASDSNNEFDQVLAAFNNSSGHKHDGTTAEGPVIGLIGDPGVTTPLNKVVVDNSNNRVGVFVDAGGAGSTVEQVRFQDGAIVPVTDNDIDLGTSSVEFKDAFFDGTVTTDALVADTADINGGSVDGATLGTNSAITQAVIDNVNIDGTTIGHTSDTDLMTLASGVLTVAGEVSLTTLDIGGTDVTATAAELNIMDGNTSASSVTVADSDQFILNDAGTMKQITASDLKTYAGGAVTSVGALDSGSITSGFGNIDNGSSTITTTGAITGGSVTADDVALDGKVITLTGSSGDTATLTAGTNGTLDIATTDAAAAAANITITADGTAELAGTTVTLNSSGGVTLDADGGTITFADGGSSLGTVTSNGFTGNLVGDVTGTIQTAAQTNITSVGALDGGSITSNFGNINNGSSTITTTGAITGGSVTADDVAIDGKVITLTGSTDDTATITAGTNGTLAITTTDTAAAAANISITADGTAELAGTTVTLNSSGGVTLDADGGTITFADGGASLGTITSAGFTGDVVGSVTLPGSSSAAGSIQFKEDTDNGTNAVTLIGPASTADVTITLPSSAGTVALTSDIPSAGISSGNVATFTSGAADNDFLRIDGTSIEGRSASEVLSDIGASAAAGSSSIVTTGALDSGSITSGFGSINNGASAITTTGVITGGTVEATGDTSAGDNAAMGFTASEGLILTGQGSTNDVTIKNDADEDVIEIPTGTTNVTVAGGLTVGAVATAKTDTDTSNTGSVTLDFSANQNFVLTLTGNVTLANPSTETVGQSGFIVCIQDGTGGRTLSLGTDYETAGGAGITLSSAASTTDIIPYVVAASNRILLGAPQLAFS